jgi:lysophospholipase L1-like esterase
VRLVLTALAIALTLRAQADRPVPRPDRNSQIAHEQLLAKKTQGRIDIYFEGDSIVRRWGANDYPQLLENWKRNFYGWNAADFGWGADKIEHILWRLENGELDGVNPKIIVLLAGTNNVGAGATADDVTRGIEAVLRVMQAKAPGATIVLTAIFPRYDRPQYMAVIDAANASLAKLADGRKIRFLNINNKLAGPDVLNPDKLHPAIQGYQVWADALKPIFAELLGPPGKEDHAPPPTGDPSARK